MRNTFSPLISSYLGFDRLFADMDSMLDVITSRGTASYPPLNLLKEENGDYTIEMALAGFRKDDIKIEHDKKRSMLTISGDTQSRKQDSKLSSRPQNEISSSSTELVTSEIPRPVIVKQGIASRSFTRSFTIADDLDVSEAELVDGLLTVKLKKIETSESKPILITLK